MRAESTGATPRTCPVPTVLLKEDAVMLLEMTNVEARELKEILDSSLRELLEEIAHADHRAYREMLQARYTRLEHLNHRLEATVESDQVYA
jgi:hypothetical protein